MAAHKWDLKVLITLGVATPVSIPRNFLSAENKYFSCEKCGSWIVIPGEQKKPSTQDLLDYEICIDCDEQIVSGVMNE